MWRQLYNYTIIAPLKYLYIQGPQVYGVGCWEGQSPSMICSQMTGQSESFWDKNRILCDAMIDTKFLSYLTMVETCAYFYILGNMITFLGKVCMVKVLQFISQPQSVKNILYQ